MSFTVGVVLAFSALLGGNSQSAAVLQMPTAQTVEEYVRVYFADIPVMAEVAKCESRFRQFSKSGSVLRGEVVQDDLGVMQVNDYFHGDTAEKLGLDLKTIQGNVAYARYLYEKEGTQPWISSKPCWGKTQAAKDYAKELALNK